MPQLYRVSLFYHPIGDVMRSTIEVDVYLGDRQPRDGETLSVILEICKCIDVKNEGKVLAY